MYDSVPLMFQSIVEFKALYEQNKQGFDVGNATNYFNQFTSDPPPTGRKRKSIGNATYNNTICSDLDDDIVENKFVPYEQTRTVTPMDYSKVAGTIKKKIYTKKKKF